MKKNISVPVTLAIRELNTQGIGIAYADTQLIEVPFSLPNEEIELEVYYKSRTVQIGRIKNILCPHPERAVPKCEHYGICGGCVLQHCTPIYHDQFKLDKLIQHLMHYQVDYGRLQLMITVPAGKRRRIDFMGKKIEDKVILGFHQRLNKRRFNTQMCPVIHSDLEALFNPLRHILQDILQEQELVHVFATRAENGLDILLAGFKRPLTDLQIDQLLQLTKHLNITRLMYKVKTQAHTIYLKEAPYIILADYKIPISPYCFLQASADSDHILAQHITKAIIAPGQIIADLFCGRGTLSLPLIKAGHQVHGFECDGDALAQLDHLGLTQLSTQVRNLFDNPLTADELRAYTAVVINPPRSGALAQVQYLSTVRNINTIVYVSCNPETFARDAKVLQDGGYKLTSVTPLDQFIWSSHLEVISVFIR